MYKSISFKGQLIFRCFVFSVLVSFEPALCQQPAVRIISMEEAVKTALIYHPLSKRAELKVQSAKNGVLASIDLGETSVNYKNGQLYSAVNDRYWEVDQHFGSPLTHIQKIGYNKQCIKLAEAEQKIAVKQLTADVKKAYNHLLYELSRRKVLKEFSVIYEDFLNVTGLPYNPADSDLLKRTLAEMLFADFQNKQFQTEQDCRIAGNQFQQALNITEELIPADSSLELYAIEIRNSGPDKFFPASHLSVFNENYDLQKKAWLVEKSKLSPALNVGYFNQQIGHSGGFQGFMVGVTVPLWYFPQKTKINEAHINQDMARNELEFQKLSMRKNIENLKIKLDQCFVQISFYRENALHHADVLVKYALKKFKNDDMDYAEFLKNMEYALKIQLDYLDRMNAYNETAIQLEYYLD
jgi:heavy metal efflux system protein